MSGKSKIKRRRFNLWNQNPHCRCCGVETVLPRHVLVEREDGRKVYPNGIPENLATIQHHDDRYSPHRGVDGNGYERTTLYCRRCNQRESDLRQRMIPKILKRAKSRLGHMKKRRKREKAPAGTIPTGAGRPTPPIGKEVGSGKATASRDTTPHGAPPNE